jgi:hypothetical protein
LNFLYVASQHEKIADILSIGTKTGYKQNVSKADFSTLFRPALARCRLGALGLGEVLGYGCAGRDGNREGAG